PAPGRGRDRRAPRRAPVRRLALRARRPGPDLSRPAAPRHPSDRHRPGGRMTAAAVELIGVSARYGEVLALDDVTLAIPAARVTAVVGVNGSGKSTMFKLVMGAM